MALLTIRDLEISFGRGKNLSHATSGVSFSVNEGEILSLVGESGSGRASRHCPSLACSPGRGTSPAGRSNSRAKTSPL